MSSNEGQQPTAAQQQDEVATVTAAADQQIPEKTASPVKPQQKPTEVDAGTGEESRDSVASVGEESVEGDEDEEAGEEEDTDEEAPPQVEKVNGDKAANGHSANGHGQQEEVGGEAAVELANGDAKSRKRISGMPDEAEDASSQKKKRVEDEESAEPEVQAAQ